MKTNCRTLLATCVLLTLAACSPKSADEAAAGEPQADAAMVAEAVGNAAETAAATHPLCDLVTFAAVQAAGGGNISKLDVIDTPGLSNIDCVYLDEGNYLGAGMSIGYITTEKLAKNTISPWSTATEYFEEWTRKGTGVTGLGEGAAWDDATRPTLYVLKGDTVVHISGTALDTSDAAVRAKVEALAQQVVARMP